MESCEQDTLCITSHTHGSVRFHLASVPDEWSSWANGVVQLAQHLRQRLGVDSCAFACLLILTLLHARRMFYQQIIGQFETCCRWIGHGKCCSERTVAQHYCQCTQG